MMAEESQAWFFVGLFQVSSKALIVKITLANSKCFCTVCSQSQLNQSKFSIDFTLPRRKKIIFCRCKQVLFMSFDFGVKFQEQNRKKTEVFFQQYPILICKNMYMFDNCKMLWFLGWFYIVILYVICCNILSFGTNFRWNDFIMEHFVLWNDF